MDIPKALILFRFLLAPIILGLAYYLGEDSKMIILILLIGYQTVKQMMNGASGSVSNLSLIKLF